MLAARLKTEEVHAIYSSDLLRASATAEAIALAREPVGTPVQAVTHKPAFRERSIGVLEVKYRPQSPKQNSSASVHDSSIGKSHSNTHEVLILQTQVQLPPILFIALQSLSNVGF